MRGGFVQLAMKYEETDKRNTVFTGGILAEFPYFPLNRARRKWSLWKRRTPLDKQSPFPPTPLNYSPSFSSQIRGRGFVIVSRRHNTIKPQSVYNGELYNSRVKASENYYKTQLNTRKSKPQLRSMRTDRANDPVIRETLIFTSWVGWGDSPISYSTFASTGNSPVTKKHMLAFTNPEANNRTDNNRSNRLCQLEFIIQWGPLWMTVLMPWTFFLTHLAFSEKSIYSYTQYYWDLTRVNWIPHTPSIQRNKKRGKIINYTIPAYRLKLIWSSIINTWSK